MIQARRRCKVCGNPITDRTRSKRCLDCRLPDPRTCEPSVKVYGTRPAAKAFAFFPGLHQPGDARHFALACISINRLWKRRKRVGNRRTRVFVDSGAFTALNKDGRYVQSVVVYARRLFELHTRGIVSIAVAAAQDYMCEPFILAKTGLTVLEHQRLTIERYDALVAELMRLFEVARPADLPFPVMPVLQGWTREDYARHVAMYGDRLTPGMWVGVGSVCKRQGKVSAIEDVLHAIKEVRPDLRLHGFRREVHGAEERQGEGSARDRRQHGLVVRRSARGARRQRLAGGSAVRSGCPSPAASAHRTPAAVPARFRPSRVRCA